MSKLALELIAKEKKEQTGILDIGKCGLTELPEELFELTWLKELNVCNAYIDFDSKKRINSQNKGERNNLSHLSKNIEKLDDLHTLRINGYFQRWNIMDFRFLEKLTNLSSLDLSENQITDIRFLEKLATTSLSKRLDISNNQIKDLSPVLPLIQRGQPVKWDYIEDGICVQENPFENPPIEIIKQGNTAILKYFEELKTQGTTELYEAKMLIIGEGGVGKTSLAKKLMDKDAELPAEKDTTKGIDIQEYHFTTTAGKDFRINIWDFGGQEIYHSTHQFFLTKRSLYVLVDDTRKDDKTRSDAAFNYWLETVELFGGGSPIVIVQNEKGNRSKALDMKSIQSRFTNVKGSYATNLLTCRDLAKTKTALEHYIQELPIVGQKLPKQWVEIRNALEAKEREGTQYLSLTDYYAVCAEHKIPEADRALLLSQYLHDLGVFLHFQEDDLLKKIIILHNEWATDAVYKVLDCESVKRAKGRFTRQDLVTIWGDDDCREKYRDMHGELLALMRKFELCYELESEKNTFLAPQLFPEERPDYDWDETDNLIVRYQYGFMPKGLLSRLIVRMHQYVQDLDTAWKNGVVLQKGTTQAEVINLYAEQKIRIRVRGPESKAFLENIIYEFEKLHREFEGIKVDKFIPCNCARCQAADWKGEYYFDYGFLMIAYQKNSSVQCQKSTEMVNVHRLINDTFVAEKMEDLSRTKTDMTHIQQTHHGAGDNVGKDKIVHITNHNYSNTTPAPVSIFDKNPQRSAVDKEELRKLIVKDEIGEVFDILLESTEDVGLRNDISLLKKRWRDNNRERRNGVISGEGFGLESRKVSEGLLDWVGEW